MGVESEPPIINREFMRAVRSFAWNQQLLPVIMDRLERAESQVRAFMLLHDCNQMRLGPYEIELRDDDSLHVTRHEQTDWTQAYLLEEIDDALDE